MIAVERYSVDDIPQDPDSWRSRCFVSHLIVLSALSLTSPLLKLLEDAVAKRLEEAGSRLRSHRMEAVERKKEREVKYTDRVPPPKRLRTGCKDFLVPALTMLIPPREHKCASKDFISKNSI